MLRTPGRESAGRARVGFACVGVADLRGEELNGPLGRLRIGRKERG